MSKFDELLYVYNTSRHNWMFDIVESKDAYSKAKQALQERDRKLVRALKEIANAKESGYTKELLQDYANHVLKELGELE